MVGPDLNRMLMMILSRVPFWLVILFGAFLCLRHSGRKPREVRLVGIALVLMVAGAGISLMLVPIVQALGFNLMGGRIVWWLISAIASLPHAAALGILFWAVFGGLGIDEVPASRLRSGTGSFVLPIVGERRHGILREGRSRPLT